MNVSDTISYSRNLGTRLKQRILWKFDRKFNRGVTTERCLDLVSARWAYERYKQITREMDKNRHKSTIILVVHPR